MAILVVYDGSESSERALVKAVEIREEDEVLHLVTVIPKAHVEAFAEVELGDESVGDARKRIQYLRKFYKLRDITIKYTVREGEPVDEILLAAKGEDCRLIVLGSGVTRIGKFQLGDISDDLKNRAGKPVMVVR
jgi:nucleotide-binding universal stress UspA family protein